MQILLLDREISIFRVPLPVGLLNNGNGMVGAASPTSQILSVDSFGAWPEVCPACSAPKDQFVDLNDKAFLKGEIQRQEKVFHE